MSSINNGIDFIYGNKKSKVMGVQLATAFGSVGRSSNIESREIISSNNPNNKTFGFHGIRYTSPTTFDLIIFNIDGTYINEHKERQLKKWLLSSNMQWLSINQPTLGNISYYCIATKAEIIDVGAYSGGMLISFQCDNTGAWSNLENKQFVSTGSKNIKLLISADYDDEIIRPAITITATSNGNISLQNSVDNKTISVTGCVSGEVIILDGNNGKIDTTANRNLMDYWNKKFLKLYDGDNNITLTGNFSMKLSYRMPVRIGG